MPSAQGKYEVFNLFGSNSELLFVEIRRNGNLNIAQWSERHIVHSPASQVPHDGPEYPFLLQHQHPRNQSSPVATDLSVHRGISSFPVAATRCCASQDSTASGPLGPRHAADGP